ncbi:alpha/beta hydrolase [Nocardiopsis sp. RSe5-2]|uniref:Alpha/beta hydrolase n=1 Tax=Nocardiopsis endophytica TaxID=3018445 RepID=A0ABT4U743_9ACTN|nr:alpha/beta hydrolase [Nocardiopsis endophytica]MDA2812769.1 alpha/beta hydrolase [Nocardiopsis endophytica]
MTDAATPSTGRLKVPGAELYYEVRGQGPLVALVGSPMNAEPFAALAGLLADGFTVLTTDPRGIRHSVLEDPEEATTVETRADDLARLLEHVGSGPAAVLGSSGGAITALALAQARPDLVGTVVPHEPPLNELLDEREEHRAATERMVGIYRSGDVVGAWSAFMESANIQMPEGALEQMFGGERDPQDVADERRFFLYDLPATTGWLPDTEALRASGADLVLGIGEDSAGELCDRTTRALAELLGTEPVLFPGGHTGFATDEAPEAFAARLRPIIGGA